MLTTGALTSHMRSCNYKNYVGMTVQRQGWIYSNLLIIIYWWYGVVSTQNWPTCVFTCVSFSHEVWTLVAACGCWGQRAVSRQMTDWLIPDSGRRHLLRHLRFGCLKWHKSPHRWSLSRLMAHQPSTYRLQHQPGLASSLAVHKVQLRHRETRTELPLVSVLK